MKPINEILTNQGTPFQKLIAKIKQLQYLNEIFLHSIDSNLAKHCQLAKIGKTEIVVVVENASWATKLHYLSPEILENLRSQPEFKNIKKIRHVIST